MTLADRFDQAFAAVERGWWQNIGRQRIGKSVCALIAIMDACPEHGHEYRDALEVVRELQQIPDEGMVSSALARWNDDPGRRKRSVLNLLERCAAVCRERGL